MDFEPIISIASKATSQLMTFIEDAAMASLQLNRSATNTEDEQITKKSLPRTKNNIIMDGYLFKRASNAFKTWHRRWFVIQNNKLYYQKRSKSGSITEMVDLRLSTVKHAEDLDRRFTFA